MERIIEKKNKKNQQIIIQEMIKYMFKNDPLKNIANRTQKCNRFIVESKPSSDLCLITRLPSMKISS
jgi:hypothetical protein